MTPLRSTPAVLDRLAAPLRRATALAGAAAALGGLALALGTMAWLVRAGITRSPGWVLVAWALALLAAVAALVWTRRALAALTVPRVAAWLERAGGWRPGAVTGVLEGNLAGTSAGLYAFADETCARALDAKGEGTLGGLRRLAARARTVGGGLLGLGAVVFLAAGPSRNPTRQLWDPAGAWAMFVAPVSLTVDRPVVDRGERVTLDLRAIGRREAVLWTRGKGEPWRSTMVTLDSVGGATWVLGPLDGDVYAYLASGSRASDTVEVKVRVPAFLGRIHLTAKYPGYLKLDDEPLPTGGDTLLLPAGTRLVTIGEATADLASAAWRLGGRQLPLAVDGGRFQGTVAPAGSGVLTLALATKDGAPLGGDPVALPIRIVPDQAPVIDVPVPGNDTVEAGGNQLPLVADVRDDHGLTAVTLHARRSAHAGAPPLEMSAALPLPAEPTDRALLQTKLDLGPLGVEPGDTVWYWVTARDNAPSPHTGRSRDYVVLVPTTVEARAEHRDATSAVKSRLDSLVAEAKKLQRQTEDLSREQQRTQSTEQQRGDQSLNFDDAKKAEAVAREQQELMKDAEKVDKALEELQKSAERAGLGDSTFQKHLEEIREQLNKALSPELKKRLEELQRALKNLDPRGAKEALKKLADAQKELKEALERSRELFKRAAMEGELKSLEQEAKDVVQQQQDWNQQVDKAAADSNQSAAAEEKLAERTDSLAKGLNQAAKQLDNQERQDQLKQTAKQAKQASQQMEQAAQQAKKGKSQAAKKSGEEAAQQLSKVQKDVQQERKEQQDEWKEEVIKAIDRALAETTRLSHRQLTLSQTFGRSASLATTRNEQGAIEEGVQKLLEQITAVSGKNALVSPQIAVALTQARLQMARAREAISSASANLREASDQSGEAVDALNVASYLMLRSREEVSGASSASGLAEAMEKMTKMAQQQGSLSQEGQNLLSMAGQQMAQQMQLLASKQRALAQEMERMRAQRELAGMKDLADEAKELARKLEAGRLDRETVERQERLFKRMLDAGRTLQGEEKDEKKERESTTAKGDSISLPPPLKARLMGADGTIRLPSWEALQRLSPEERRLVTDYFRRLTEGKGR